MWERGVQRYRPCQTCRWEARPEATCDDAVVTPAVVSPAPAEEPSPLVLGYRPPV